MQKLKPNTSKEFLIAFGAGFAALAASLANLLAFDGYPFFRTEILLILVAIAALAALISFAYINSRQIVKVIYDASLAFIFMDLNTSGWLIPIAAFAVGAILSVVLGKNFLAIFGTFIGFVLLSSLSGLAETRPFLITQVNTGGGDTQLSEPDFAVVHVLLDEHIGLGGFPRNKPGREAQSRLQDSYQDMGFTIFENAFSRHFHTVNAIPDALNLNADVDLFSKRENYRIAPPLEYFRELSNDGFKTVVYQSDYLEICENNSINVCSTYRYGSLNPLLQGKLGPSGRARIIAANLASFSEVISHFNEIWDAFAVSQQWARGWEIPLSPVKTNRTAPLSSVFAARQFISVLESARPGNAYFFHPILPHYPYAFSADCIEKSPKDWLTRRDAVSIRGRESAYFEQLLCARKLIKDMLLAIDKSPASGKFVFILQGDHGSRITTRDPRSYSSSISDADFRAAFSTIFAVRFREPAPRIDSRTRSVPVLLRQLVSTQFEALPSNTRADDRVWLDDSDGTPRRQVLIPRSVWSSNEPD